MRDLINIIDEAANQSIVQYLNQAGYQDLKVKGNNIIVLAQIPDGEKKAQFRAQILADLLNTMNRDLPNLGPYKGDNPQISSLGYIAFQNDPSRIVVKDSGIQGDQSAGVANEAELAALLASVVEKYGSADVTFRDPRGNTLSIKNVTAVETTGKDVAERKKADVLLKSKTKKLPVSIKKLDAETWESADSMFGARAREIIDDLVEKGVVELIDIGAGGKKLSKEIVVEPTEEEAMNAIFGSDINPEGGIVIQTFKPEHFVQDGNKVVVDCHAVIKNKDDIPESHMMVWLLRNNAGRLSKTLGIRGIRPMASVLTRAIGRRGDKDVILVDKNGNVVERPKAEPKRPAVTDYEPPRSKIKARREPEKGEPDLGRKRR